MARNNLDVSLNLGHTLNRKRHVQYLKLAKDEESDFVIKVMNKLIENRNNL